MSTIKVMEPTHPLFGKTLKLMSEQCGGGKAFVAVGLKDGRRRLILYAMRARLRSCIRELKRY
jgi:hypothetical protein